MTVTTTSTDCEGKCCCRCTPCAGIGYYDSYDVTVPGIAGYTYSYGCEGLIATAVPSVTSAKTYTCVGFETSQAIFGTGGPLTPPVYASQPPYGSAGGDGNCRWSYYNVTSVGVGIFAYQVMEYIVFHGNSVDAYYQVTSTTCLPHAFFLASAHFSPAGDCRVPGTMPYDGSGTVVYSGTSASATAVPSAGANWYQCGENSDGTTYVSMGASPIEVLADLVRRSVGPSVSVTKAQPLPVLRPVRCAHLGRRSEFLAGCGGWMCGHECGKSLPAVPGGYCQSCVEYDSDLDYESHGVSGWTK